MILYKYFPCNEFTFKSLANYGLWCHHSKAMNDPFECLGYQETELDENEYKDFIDYVKQSENPKVRELISIPKEGLLDFFNKVRKHGVDNYAFCSLSQNSDDVLMWSHYANEHKGIVVGFEFEPSEMPYELYKVNYFESFPKLNLIEATQTWIGEPNFLEKYLVAISSKSIHWKYEQEYRIWAREPGYYKYKKSQIKELYFGVRCDIQTKVTILQILVDQIENVDIFDYELNNSPISLDKKKFEFPKKAN